MNKYHSLALPASYGLGAALHETAFWVGGNVDTWVRSSPVKPAGTETLAASSIRAYRAMPGHQAEAIT